MQRNLLLCLLVFAMLHVDVLGLGKQCTGCDQIAPPDRLEITVDVDVFPKLPSGKNKRPIPRTIKRTVVLSRYSIRSDDYRIRIWTKSKEYQPFKNPPVRTYRGFSKGRPNERVTAVLYSDGKFQAQGTTGKLYCWQIKKPIDVSKQVRGEPGTDEGKSHWPGSNIQRSAAKGPFKAFPPNRSLMRTQLAGDITNLCVENLGNVDNAIAWTEWQTCLSDETYVRNLALSIELTDVIVRKEKFYPGTKSGEILGPLRDYWKTRESKGNWDYVNGFTANEDGLSYRGGPHSAGPLTHEVGHSFNMAHSIFGVGMQNPVCHDRALLHFQKRKLYPTFDKAPAPAGKHPYVVHPYTAPDVAITQPNEPITIPVLANDWDSNGQAIAFKEFTEKTRAGGTVKIEKIEAKQPQDPTEQLIYTPPNDYVGKDAIAYTVQNESGLHSTEIAHIYIVDDKSDLAAHWPMDRLSSGKSPNLIEKKQTAALHKDSSGARSIQGKIGKAIQLGPDSQFICGDVKITPKPPSGFLPGYKVKWAWYPVEDQIGNLFDPLDRNFSAAFWIQVGPPIAGAGKGKKKNGPRLRVSKKGVVADGSPTSDVVFCKTDEDIVDAVGFRITTTDNIVRLTIKPFDGLKPSKDAITVAHQKKLLVDQWHHITMVINRQKNEASVWVDGKESQSKIKLEADSLIFAGRGDLALRSPVNAMVAFDDLRVAYRAFDKKEIESLAASK